MKACSVGSGAKKITGNEAPPRSLSDGWLDPSLHGSHFRVEIHFWPTEPYLQGIRRP